ncbi:uncharacterized protein LOC131612999 isoform X4 [Vicia villosa]|uniref:uncharacterized protein LOC131612999 isoform X4 n=1 Tax=Vicia villosa TaxID=3911 RepID=UPI00273C5AA2|nr:uncharacterized protein LOC131612999 isoform X4 [Vicia villosa]
MHLLGEKREILQSTVDLVQNNLNLEVIYGDTDSIMIYSGLDDIAKATSIAKKVIQEGLEVFRKKHVLVFISSLDSIEDEISLLNSIYERLQENSKESIKGFNKEDFKILWIPIKCMC